MKNTFLFLTILALLSSAPAVQADSMAFTETFGDLEITNTYTFAFDLSSVQGVASSLDGATLSLTHNGNSNNAGEFWLTTSGGTLSIGTLSTSTAGNAFVTDTWTLSAAVLSEITGQNPWALTIHLDDNTTGSDKIIIQQSTLNVDFTPAEDPITPTTSVPEPSTALLLASGAIGVLIRRRKK